MSDDKKDGYNFDDDVFGDDPFGSSEPETSEKPAEPTDSPVGDTAGFEGFEGFNDEVEPASEAKPDAAPVKAKKSGGGIVGLLKDNIIYIVGGVVVIGIAYYLFTTMIFTGSPQRQAQPRQQQQQSQGFGLKMTPVKVPTKQAAQKQPVQRTAGLILSKKDLQTMVTGFSKIVQDQSATVQKQITTLSTQVKSLSSTQATTDKNLKTDTTSLTTLSKQVKQLNTTLTGYNKTLSSITNSLKTTQAQLKLLLAQKASDRTHLTLRAIVPGRAWLVNKDKKTITVAVGDSVPYYGKVDKINSKNGTVTMSSGYVFN